jgi:hypothetical protein
MLLLYIMKRSLQYIFLLLTIGVSAYFIYQKTLVPCDKPLRYSIGRFDTQFGISKEEFKSYLAQSEVVWEKALNKNEFIYDTSSNFKINLVYDERQLSTTQKQKTEFGLSAVEETLKQLDFSLNVFRARYDQKIAAYENTLALYNQRKVAYDEAVSFWNKKGGAPPKEYNSLEEERHYLNTEAQRLNTETLSLNIEAQELNDLLKERNIKAIEYNKMVAAYNKKYGQGGEFNQAEYTGKAINVYQFGSKEDLVLALTHEFGHALGMDHVESSDSIMYYLSDENTGTDLYLSADDLAELKKVCELK